MGRAYIGLGSNLGDGRQNLLEAWRRLGEQSGVALVALSSPYLTRPVAKPEWLAAGKVPGEQLFTNGVGIVESALLPRQLLQVMQEIESAMGRERARSVDRPVDLDLLYYDDLVLSEADLLLPHPEIQARRFVLVPLAELAPELRHPALGLTTSQMLQRLGEGDEGEIQRLAWVQRQELSNSAGKACR